MVNFIKHNRKLLIVGKMKTVRVERFNGLLELGEKNRRGNQYE
jgi:hypothetical protein